MRVTDSSIYALANARIMKARSDNVMAGDEVSTGKRIQHPWDDAGGAGMMVRHQQESARQTGIYDAATRASGELTVVDGALDVVTTSLSRAKELAVQLGNDTYSAQDRADAAAEVQQLFSSVISQLNVKYGDRYLFSGQDDSTQPFDTSGNYLGSATGRKVEIAPNVLNDASARADVAFKGTAGGVDVLATLQTLATALQSNDAAGIRTVVGNFDTAITQVSTERSRVGAMQNTFDMAATAAKKNSETASDAKDSIESSDIFEASTRYAATQTALQATLSAASQSFKFTLLDKL